MRWLRGWRSDLALGVRLAVGGGRTSLARFALSAVGIAVAVVVLLTAASVDTMLQQRQERAEASEPVQDPVLGTGTDPLYLLGSWTVYRERHLPVTYVHAGGADAPVPPGIPRVPEEGESFVSPGLAELLSSADGELLRPRFADVAGTIDKSVIREPGEMTAYIGADADLSDHRSVLEVYGFGQSETQPQQLPPELLLLLLLGVVALLIPVFIFVVSSSRIAGAERDRRLSALRLVGAGSRQVRRIAAAEAMVGAAGGLLLGAGLFLFLRQYAEEVELFGVRVYVGDVVPVPWLAVLTVLVVPVLAVLTAQFALRGTVIEPLGVVRRARPVRRRLWWRLVPIAVGVLLLLRRDEPWWEVSIAVGAALLLIGIPLLLAWLVERVANRLHGGPTSWQLAVRRLQLDSGTSARVVGGVAVVLASAIALLTVLVSFNDVLDVPESAATDDEQQIPFVEASLRSEDSDQVDDVEHTLRQASGVRAAFQMRTTWLQIGDSGAGYQVNVLDCAAIRAAVDVNDCADGAVYRFRPQPGMPVAEPGTTLRREAYDADGNVTGSGTWTVPDDLRTLPDVEVSALGPLQHASLIATPAALADATLPPEDYTQVVALLDTGAPDGAEHALNALAPFDYRVNAYAQGTGVELNDAQETYLTIRTGLFAGAVFTLLLAGVSVLVLALEQIRERRRPLAVLAASGVPRAVLARSMLWQVMVPIVLGMSVAVIVGTGLGMLMIRLTAAPMLIDWTGIGLLFSIAVVFSMLVTALTLPSLRNATKLTALRTE